MRVNKTKLEIVSFIFNKFIAETAITYNPSMRQYELPPYTAYIHMIKKKSLVPQMEYNGLEVYKPTQHILNKEYDKFKPESLRYDYLLAILFYNNSTDKIHDILKDFDSFSELMNFKYTYEQFRQACDLFDFSDEATNEQVIYNLEAIQLLWKWTSELHLSYTELLGKIRNNFLKGYVVSLGKSVRYNRLVLTEDAFLSIFETWKSSLNYINFNWFNNYKEFSTTALKYLRTSICDSLSNENSLHHFMILKNKEKILKVKEIIQYTKETLSIVTSNVITRLFQDSTYLHLISYSDYSFQTLLIAMEFNINSLITIEDIFERLDKLIDPKRRTYTLKKVYLNFKPDVLELMETKYSKLLTLMKYQGALVVKG